MLQNRLAIISKGDVKDYNMKQAGFDHWPNIVHPSPYKLIAIEVTLYSLESTIFTICEGLHKLSKQNWSLSY